MAADDSGRAPFAQWAGRLKPQLLQALSTMGLTHSTPVQEKVLQLPSFAQDCLVQAKTGTGKTIAFLLPALQNLLSASDLERSFVALLVLAPTRELAQQIVDECNKLTAACEPPLECHIAVGGSSRKSHLARFLNGKPTILVATPGRLIDYLSEEAARDRLSKVRCVVLDEADRMLDAGFAPALYEILEQLPPKAEAQWQGMCFSATVPPEIEKMLPMVLAKDHARISTIDKNEVPTVETVPQSVYPVGSVDDVLPTLHSVLSCARADNPALKAIVFCPTARHAGLLYHVFGHTGGAAPPKLPVFQMHSRMSQTQRTRTVDEFKATDRGLMFASDVVGRGMDFPDISLVVQIGVPGEKDQYVHRVGRTGRAGKLGRAVMILAPEEMWFVEKHPEFPIKNEGPFTHPKAAVYPSRDIIQSALAKVPLETKEQAYTGNLGFIKSMMKRYGLDRARVVDLANRFARAFGCPAIPELNPVVVAKMGLRGVPGLVLQGHGLVTTSASKSKAGSKAASVPGSAPAESTAGGSVGGSNKGRGSIWRDQKAGGEEGAKEGEEPSRKRPRR
ncbi:bcfa9434-e356-4cd5-b67d-6798695fda4a [Thermothielavioides terrestris]|uniref:ATP-dependent RNA helicase n=1 Tax=Thermothielavioides terrestris TaxID=2587410 RepID=A0A446BGC2_9PEZI|nr:bcfa9434-e356-4cd5-b67d-6798695fda4a [Thermothielavioides terrestris]